MYLQIFFYLEKVCTSMILFQILKFPENQPYLLLLTHIFAYFNQKIMFSHTSLFFRRIVEYMINVIIYCVFLRILIYLVYFLSFPSTQSLCHFFNEISSSQQNRTLNEILWLHSRCKLTESVFKAEILILIIENPMEHTLFEQLALEYTDASHLSVSPLILSSLGTYYSVYLSSC